MMNLRGVDWVCERAPFFHHAVCVGCSSAGRSTTTSLAECV